MLLDYKIILSNYQPVKLITKLRCSVPNMWPNSFLSSCKDVQENEKQNILDGQNSQNIPDGQNSQNIPNGQNSSEIE